MTATGRWTATEREADHVLEEISIYRDGLCRNFRLRKLLIGECLKPRQLDGLIAAGYAGPVPSGKLPLKPGHAVYYDKHFRTGNYITAILHTIVLPDQVLPIADLEKAGNLRHVPWKNAQSPGGEIKPNRKLKMNLDVLPELQELWERHLEKIDFPLPPDQDEIAAIERFGCGYFRTTLQWPG